MSNTTKLSANEIAVADTINQVVQKKKSEGITQKDIGKMIGYSPCLISAVRHKRHPATVGLLESLCNLFEYDAMEFIHGRIVYKKGKQTLTDNPRSQRTVDYLFKERVKNGPKPSSGRSVYTPPKMDKPTRLRQTLTFDITSPEVDMHISNGKLTVMF